MRLLDLFCGAGGAAMGYYRAGFTEIVGVDNRPMPRYPFTFVLGDALEYCAAHGHEFDAIHASPPCQAYGQQVANLSRRVVPRLIPQTRKTLIATGRPYVIENIPGAPLADPVLLCGSMFDLGTYRHRLFETSFSVPFFLHQTHGVEQDKLYGPTKQRQRGMVVVVGKGQYAGYLPRAMTAMGIDWMRVEELAEAIPPAYTEYIGKHLLEHIRSCAR